MLLTREACRQKEEEIRKLREKLNEVRREKGEQVAQAPGDNRHDNFGLEQAEIQERAIMNEIRELDAQLKNASIVENLAHKSKQIVQVEDRVKLELNYENDRVITMEYKLVALPTEERSTITLNSPIGKVIFHKEVGFEGECKVANGNRVKIIILEIN